MSKTKRRSLSLVLVMAMLLSAFGANLAPLTVLAAEPDGSEAELISVAGEALAPGGGGGQQSNPITASINALNTQITTDDIVASSAATVELYDDSSFSTAQNSISLHAGENQVYIKVTSQDETNIKHYHVTVNVSDAQQTTASAYNVSLTINKDGQPFEGHGKAFTLRQAGETKAAGSAGTGGTVTFDVPDGTYNIFDGSDDTGETIVVSGTADKTLHYYTVEFRAEDAGASNGSAIIATYNDSFIASGAVVLGGKTLVIAAEGRGATSSPPAVLEAGYSYQWSGDGANNQTADSLTINNLDRKIDVLCTVEGSLRLYAAGRNSTDAAKAHYALPEVLTSGQMTVEFDYVTTVTGPNTAVSLVHSGAAVNTDVVGMNALVRFNTGIGAYNGNGWGPDVISPLKTHTSYHLKLTIDMTAKTYSAWVTPEGGSEIELAKNFAFRAKDPANIAELRVLDTRTSGNNGVTKQMWVENITVSKKPELTVLLDGEPHPDISDMEFTLVQDGSVKAVGAKDGNKVTFNETLSDGLYDIYVDGANTNVKLAIAGGIGSATVDLGTDEGRAKKALQELVTAIEGHGLKEERYTPATWGPFAAALNEAKSLLLDDAATAEALNTALSNLSNAYESLALIPRANGIYKAAYADKFGGTVVRTGIGNTSNGATYPNGSYSSPPAGQPNDRSVLGGFHTGSDPQTYRAKPGAGVTFPFTIHKDGEYGFMLKFSRVNYEIEDYISVYVNYDQVEKNENGSPKTPGEYRIPLAGRDSELVFVESDIWTMDLKEGDTISLVLDTSSLDVVDKPDRGLVNIDYLSVWEVEESHTYDSFNRNFYLLAGSEIVIPEPVAFPLTWTSSDPEIATVDSVTGRIQALKAGDVVMTSTGIGGTFKYNLYVKDSEDEIKLKSAHVSLWDMENNVFDPPAAVRNSNANEVPENIPIALSGLSGGTRVGNGFVDTMDYVPVGSSVEVDVPGAVVDKPGLYDITLNYAKGSSQASGQLGLLVNGQLAGTLYTRTTASLASTEQSNIVTAYLKPGDTIGIRTIVNPKDAVGRFNSLTVTENVVIPPSSVTLSTPATVNHQDQTTLNYTTVPANATPAFVWTAADTDIVSVYGNLVVGENVGETTVTATSLYNPDVKSTATVAVTPNHSVFSIESDEMKVYLDKDFPRAIQYEMKDSGAKIDGNRTKLDTLRLTTGMTYSLNTSQGLTGSTVKDYKPVVASSETVQNADGSQHVIYTMKVTELNAELKIKATVDGTVLKFDFIEIKEEPENRIFVIEIPDHNPVTVSNFNAGASFAGSKMESNIGRSGDSFLQIGDMMSGSDYYNYAFVSNGTVAASIKSNAFGLTDGSVARRVYANTKRNDSLVTTSLLSGSWVWRFPDATKKFVDFEGRYGEAQTLITRTYTDEPYEKDMPHVWVVLAEENNNDGIVNWQDAANAFREVAKTAVGSDKIADAVVQRLIMSQGNETNYPYLSSVDETKRIWLHTDGLGQIILQKYHNAGNWGDFSVYDDQLGGLDEFRKFVDITTNQYNSFVGVHTNFTEYFAKVDQFSYENVEMQADGITPRSKGYVAFGYYLHQAYVIDDQLDALTRYNENEASQEKSRYERMNRFKTDIPNLGFIYSDVYSHNGWRGNALARDYEDNGLAYFVEWPYVSEDAAAWAHWSVEKSYSPASLKGYSSDIARFIFNDTKDRWDNYSTDNWKTDIEKTRVPNSAFLLMGADTTSYEGWVHNGINEYDSIVEKIYRNNIPSKYMQHFPVTRMDKDENGWADYIEFNNGEVKVYAEGYQNAGNDTRNSKRIIEKDGKKIYEQANTIGTDQGSAKYLIPWDEGDMQKLDEQEEKEIKLYHWNDDGGSTTWELPDSWEGLHTVYMYKLSDQGKSSERALTVQDGKITLNAEGRTPYVVYKEQQDIEVDVDFGEGQYVYNPGFSTGSLKGWNTTSGNPAVVRNDNANMSLFTTSGAVAQPNSNADNRGRSRNYELAVKDGNEAEVSQTITGLTPGDEYAVSVMAEVQRGKTRKASLLVDTEGDTVSNYTDSSILLNYDRYDSKEKTGMLRMRVVFTADAPTATIKLHVAAGEGEVRFDNVRVYRTTTPTPKTTVTDGEVILYQDFESAPDGTTEAGTSINKPTFEGFYPFNLGNGGGFREARTIMQRRHEPYTQNNTVPDWGEDAPDSVRSFVQPTKDQAGNTVTGQWWDTTTIPIDLVVDGKTSFSNITGSAGIMYQTTPQSIRFEEGKTYRISFDYQTGLNGIFAFVLGSGMNGTLSQKVSSTNVEFAGLQHYDYLQGTMGPYFNNVTSNRPDGGVPITAMPEGWAADSTYRNIDIKKAVPNWRGYYEFEFVSDSDQTWFGILRNNDTPAPSENPNPFIIDNLMIVEVGNDDSESNDATLSDLTVSAGALSPAFSSGTTSYSVNVANSVSSMTIAATANDSAATVSGAGAKALSVGANTFHVVVTAEDGTQKTYTIAVTRASAPPTGPITEIPAEPAPTPTPTPTPKPDDEEWILQVEEDANAEIMKGNSDQTKAAENAVKAAAASNANTSVTIAAVAPPVIVKPSGDDGKPYAVTLSIQQGEDHAEMTTMAIVNADGSLTPVPTRMNGDGTVTVIVRGEVMLVPVNVKSGFIDTTGHYAEEEIARAAELMLVNGKGNGGFAPSGKVTVAEAITIFLRALGIPANKDATTVYGVEQDKWYAEHVHTAADHHLIDGTKIDPDSPMTRMQTATLIANALKALHLNPKMSVQEANEWLKGFADTRGLTASERIDLAISVKLGIFKGNGDGTMNPHAALQRAHLASLAVRFQDYMLER
ncbi:endo-alpha-N-acetylgalactosaminidase family protein [Paenibacillus soyae]|uniref:Endo-alpha-N-acetylgalactosaminidase family protein n=1 Tax=Paenibacillus soyae TaxID=2969249 RepID=A0A9X2MMQ6_9BACL|nr:endo-alpha-N-acetylgalactosaminidase family protein [Paenibacillus soyae]MCR2803559.1 endo-alpha-N-acetylgalactosaminidase family protein [Paenibacillus soyae]